PLPGYSGPADFEYMIRDSFGASTIARVNVEVVANNAPVTVGESFATRQDVDITIPVATLLSNDYDLDGDTLEFAYAWSMTGGSLVVMDGNVIFQPLPGYSGTASFEYMIRDSFGAASIASVSVEVAPNNAPVAVDDTITVSGGSRVTIDVQSLLANDSDPDGDTLNVNWVGNFSSGWGYVSGSTIEFWPDTYASGPVTFDYQVSDTSGGYSTARATLDFGPVNTAPTSGTDIIVSQQLSPQPVVITQAQLLANDTDAEGDAFSITYVGDAFHGAVAYDQDGNIVFTPDAGFSGLATFRYTTTDARGASESHQVTVDVPAAPTLTVTPVLAGTGQTTLASYISYGGENNDMAALTEGGHVVAWGADGTLTARVFSQTGEVVAEIHPQGNPDEHPNTVKVTTLPDGGFAVAWAAYSANSSSVTVYAQRFLANGTPVGAAAPVNAAPNSSYYMQSLTALQDGGLVVTYSLGTSQILGNKIAADGTLGTQFRVDTSSTGYKDDAQVVALQGGGFVIGYNIYTDADLYLYQMFDSNGAKVGAEKSFATSYEPTFAAFGNGFIATWASADDNIYVQTFNSDGTALTAPRVAVNYPVELSPSITVLSDGGYVLSWRTPVPISAWGNQADVVAQRFDALGNAVTEPFRVHSANPNWQYKGELIERSDGSLVAVWVSQYDTDVYTTIETAVLAPYTRIEGNNAENTLTSGAGADMLAGGGRADTYLAGRGTGADLVDNVGQGADGDRVLFGADVATDQLWFQRVGDSLKVSVVGTTDSLTVDAWYNSEQNHVSSFQTNDGHTLAHTQVETLVQAMSTFAPPAQGQTELTTEQHQALDTVIAANWQNS
ncbi:MAG: cadherin-like domain-containing protein, partial [Rhodospirillaceae bacterium]|nr:cadherin-like domain-containing protein [Rhodospirillales bacterium]